MNAPIPTTTDRTKYVGGSDIAAIIGISPYKTAVDLWLDKTTPPADDPRNAAAKRRGSRLEPYIADMIVISLRAGSCGGQSFSCACTGSTGLCMAAATPRASPMAALSSTYLSDRS